MSIFDKVIKGRFKLFNSEQSDIIDVGFDDVRGNIDQDSINWGDKLPDLIIPSVKNLRLCADKSPIVNGILEDLVIKSISGWVIEGDNQGAIDFIIKEDERMDYSTLMHNVVWNNCVEGVDFRELVIDKNEVTLRELAYDGDNYRIKEIYDDKTGSEIIGYKQIVKVNKNTNRGWQRKLFHELFKNQEVVEYNFDPDDLMVASFFRRHDRPRGLVANVLDDAYMHQMLKKMLPQIVFKQANTLFLQIGNKDRKEVNLDDKDVDNMVKALSDYHNLGVTALPFGIEPQLIGDTNLPDVQDYLKYLEHCIFVGLFTPEAVYSSSSSNRSTAVVQLDSDKSGRVLVQEYIQEKLSRYMEQLFNLMLELKGIKGKVWINFNPEINEGTYLEGSDDNNDDNNSTITNENGNVSTSKPNDGLNLKNIRNTERGVAGASA